MAEIKTGTGDSLIGPELGLSDGWVYILWSILSQSGLEAGTARTQFVAFPPGNPEKTIPSAVILMPEEEQPYAPYSGGLALTQLVKPPDQAWASTDYIMQPSTMIGDNADLAVALARWFDERLGVYYVSQADFPPLLLEEYELVPVAEEMWRYSSVTAKLVFPPESRGFEIPFFIHRITEGESL